MILFLTAALAADVDCEAPTREADVRATLDEAYASLEGLDITAFKASTDVLDAAIPCLADPLAPKLIAEIHRTKGIRAFGEAAGRMWAAARTIDPGYRFPYNLIPDGNPIREAYLAVDVAERTVETLEAPSTGDLRFDGYSTVDRPASFPTFAQYVRADGGVAFSRYLQPSDPVPDYPTGPVAVPDPVPVVPMPTPQPVPAPQPVAQTPRRSARAPLWLGAGIAAVASGITYGIAGTTKQDFLDPTTPDADLDGLRSRANTLVIVSGFGAATAVGLTVGGALAKPSQGPVREGSEAEPRP
jgi:hypothetical protein